MIVTDLSNSFNPVPKIKQKESKKHKQTKATEIPTKVKEIVWKRDNCRCIFCHKFVPVECACCHLEPRSKGRIAE